MAEYHEFPEKEAEEELVTQSSSKYDEIDSVHSGESKFKHYIFTPNASRRPEDMQRCIDFWKFIDTRKDLFPEKGFKIPESPCQSTSNKKKKNSLQSSKEDEITWEGILNLLKEKKLDKVANVHKSEPKELCKVETCYEESQRKSKPKNVKDLPLKSSASSDVEFDDFRLDNLDTYDPQKVTYDDAECQTDPIEIDDKETQTDFPDSLMDFQANIKDLDDLLKEVADADLTGYFDCICDDPCAWLPYPTSTTSKASSHEMRAKPGKKSKKKHAKQDKCTCSCGETNCLCSLCAQILKTIENARDSFEKLSSFEIESCPCTNTSCACLEDYRTLLDVKLEINRTVRAAAEDPEAKFGLPIKCKCSCEQPNCPCQIVMKLFTELDELMGYKADKEAKPLFFHEKEIGNTFGVDVCRCDGEDFEEEHCACLSFYKKHIQAKIEQNQSKDAQESKNIGSFSSKTSSEINNFPLCGTICSDEHTLMNCDTTKIEKMKNSKETSTKSSDQTCYCDIGSCLDDYSSESVLNSTKLGSDATLLDVPPNSAEITCKQSHQSI